MRSFYVIGNWKMNGSRAFTKELLTDIQSNMTQAHSDVQFVVCPSHPLLPIAQAELTGSRIALGAQDVSPAESGAFTGDVSVSMLKECDCRYVILGHSERRTIHKESNAQVAEKIAALKDSGITPIFCVGETLEERQANQTEAVIQAQLDALLNRENGIEIAKHCIIAYEPVWAIGTGLAATPDQVQDVHRFIRDTLTQKASVLSDLSILYGGSVKPANASEIFACADVDGGLIGGASLKAADFIGIAKCYNKSS